MFVDKEYISVWLNTLREFTIVIECSIALYNFFVIVKQLTQKVCKVEQYQFHM